MQTHPVARPRCGSPENRVTFGSYAPHTISFLSAVSFQETGAADGVASGGLRVEFPMILRRGSIAPLAARIRANRPPTAPPGSIYMRHEFHERR